MLVLNSLFILVTWVTQYPGTVAYPTDNCHSGTSRCFWMASGFGNWDTGRTKCQADGGDLAVMETEELFDFVNASGL